MAGEVCPKHFAQGSRSDAWVGEATAFRLDCCGGQFGSPEKTENKFAKSTTVFGCSGRDCIGLLVKLPDSHQLVVPNVRIPTSRWWGGEVASRTSDGITRQLDDELGADC